MKPDTRMLIPDSYDLVQINILNRLLKRFFLGLLQELLKFSIQDLALVLFCLKDMLNLLLTPGCLFLQDPGHIFHLAECVRPGRQLVVQNRGQ